MLAGNGIKVVLPHVADNVESRSSVVVKIPSDWSKLKSPLVIGPNYLIFGHPLRFSKSPINNAYANVSQLQTGIIQYEIG
jgi:hypothetical protein